MCLVFICGTANVIAPYFLVCSSKCECMIASFMNCKLCTRSKQSEFHFSTNISPKSDEMMQTCSKSSIRNFCKIWTKNCAIYSNVFQFSEIFHCDENFEMLLCASSAVCHVCGFFLLFTDITCCCIQHRVNRTKRAFHCDIAFNHCTHTPIAIAHWDINEKCTEFSPLSHAPTANTDWLADWVS